MISMFINKQTTHLLTISNLVKVYKENKRKLDSEFFLNKQQESLKQNLLH